MAFQLSKNQFLNCNSMTQTTRRIYTSSITFLGKPHRRTSLTATGAQKFVKDLNEEERSLLMTALSKRNNFLAMQAGLPLVQQPSIQELYKLGNNFLFHPFEARTQKEKFKHLYERLGFDLKISSRS